jgi:hypothetical protein
VILVNGFSGAAYIVEHLKTRLSGSPIHWISDSPAADTDIFDMIKVSPKFLESIPAALSSEKWKWETEDFYEFATCYQRHWRRHEFDSQDIFNVYMLYLRYWWSFFARNEVKAIIFSNIPHEGHDVVLLQEAKRRGIPALLMFQSTFPDKCSAFTNLKEIGTLSDSAEEHNLIAAGEAINRASGSNDIHYMRGWSGWPLIRNRLKQIAKHVGGAFLRWDASAIVELIRAFEFEYWFQTLPNFEEDQMSQGKFVYFPLHLQPELTTGAIGDGFEDQLYALEQLSRKLPTGWKIVAKENPKQTLHYRGRLYRARLARLKNVIVAGSRTESRNLIKHSKLVATVTGTAGFEALCLGKPVIIFGHAWYRNLAGVTRFSGDLDLELSSRLQFSRTDLEESLARYLQALKPGVVDDGYRKIVWDFSEEANKTKIVDGIVMPWLSEKSIGQSS